MLIYTYWNNVACRGLRSGISVSDEACPSPMGLQSGILLSDEYQMKHAGLRSGMLVSNGSLIGLVDNNNIFGNKFLLLSKHDVQISC